LTEFDTDLSFGGDLGIPDAPAAKAVLLDLARCWVRLAELADKNSHLDLVYETPGPWLPAEE
jgi:hypothetical protein